MDYDLTDLADFEMGKIISKETKVAVGKSCGHNTHTNTHTHVDSARLDTVRKDDLRKKTDEEHKNTA